jgi:DNA-binding response OmpR family regulator
MDRPARILIVDDDVDICKMLQFYFTNLGYEVQVTYTGAGAIRSVGDVRPDLIVLDIQLPDSNGYTIARTLRADRYTASIPIIFLSAHSGKEERVAGLELGADDFIAKPFDAQELRLRIERILKS